VQKVSWDKGGTVKAGDYNFFLWKRKRITSIGNRIPIRNGLKQGDALSPLLFIFALEYIIRRVQVTQVA
jgi:hypothetical protein